MSGSCHQFCHYVLIRLLSESNGWWQSHIENQVVALPTTAIETKNFGVSCSLQSVQHCCLCYYIFLIISNYNIPKQEHFKAQCCQKYALYQKMFQIKVVEH